MNHGEKARDLREKGFNCAQCVFAAIAPDFGIEEKSAKKIASGLGGGFGGLQGPCGALTGGILAIGTAFSGEPGEKNDPESKARVYAKTKLFVERFRAEFGNTECLSLLGVRIGSEEYNRDADLYKSKCGNFIERGCALASDVIAGR